MSEKSFKDLPEGDQHLREDRISGEDIYGGIFLHMKRDKILLPDGQEAVREYLTHPGAVAILAILDDGRVLLERQYRYPIAKAVLKYRLASWRSVKIIFCVPSVNLRKRQAIPLKSVVIYVVFIL